MAADAQHPDGSESVRDRRDRYAAAGLAEGDVHADPIVQFGRWMDDAVEAGMIEPTAMVVATVDRGAPSARLVLLKGIVDGCFRFFTNLESAKGRDLAATPLAALVFPWHDLQRQVRVVGEVERVPDAAADEYFAGRPRGAQVSAWASPQSEAIPTRAALEARAAAVEDRFAAAAVLPRPEFWGGFALRPRSIEFWQGRQHRLHDRLRYRRDAGTWVIERLAP